MRNENVIFIFVIVLVAVMLGPALYVGLRDRQMDQACVKMCGDHTSVRIEDRCYCRNTIDGVRHWIEAPIPADVEKR